MLYLRLSLFSILLIGMPLCAMDNEGDKLSIEQMRFHLQQYTEWPEHPDEILYGYSLEGSLAYRQLKDAVQEKDQRAVTLLRTLHTQIEESTQTTALQVFGNVAKGSGLTLLGGMLALLSWESGMPILDACGTGACALLMRMGMRGAHTSMEQLDYFSAIHEKLAEHKTTLAALLQKVEQ